MNIVCSRDGNPFNACVFFSFFFFFFFDAYAILVGHVRFLERENASILNASIMTFAQRTIRGYKRAMDQLGLKCPLYLTQVRNSSPSNYAVSLLNF
jgi:hypothetical protein